MNRLASYFTPSGSWLMGLVLIALGAGSFVFGDNPWVMEAASAAFGAAVITLRGKLERSFPE
jgi:hypothetical protein